MKPKNTLKELAQEYLDYKKNSSQPCSFYHRDVLIRILLDVEKYSKELSKDIDDWATQVERNL